MKSYTYKINKFPNYTLERILNIDEILDPELVDFIQRSFINCYEINDVDIRDEDFNFKSYIKDTEILLVKEGTRYLCFGVVPPIPSLDGFNLYFYMPKSTSPKLFKSLVKASVYFCLYLKKDLSEYSSYVYFDTYSIRIFNWIKDIIPSLQVSEIRDRYMLCYSPLDSKYIKNIILKDCEISLC